MKELDYKTLLRDLVELSWKHKNPHINTCLSALPVICEIYNEQPNGIFVLSKGHAWYALVVVLRALRYNPKVEYTHPEIDVANGVWCSTGSLGHGLPIAIGLALGFPDRKVNVLLGDNEAMEGTFWECLHIIEHFGIGNIRIHIDANGRGATEEVFSRLDTVLKPKAYIVSHATTRGAGIPYCEAHPDWHKHDLTEADYKSIKDELQ